MKKKFALVAAIPLSSVFALGAQTLTKIEKPKGKKDGPELLLTYPSGHKTEIDVHKLYPPNDKGITPGTQTVGWISQLDPMQDDKFKINAARFRWNIDKPGNPVQLVTEFKNHLKTHADALKTTPEKIDFTIKKAHQMSLQILGLK